ncbi:DUF6745 domain-containing protein [Nonomuraea sp. NPDC050783]|uniref:DUF6745 domain-containing protein n=1 Tax=Nonomuraea sp. NPDC050783 TaxID=3154634 RepID=UPI00346638F0
METLTWERAAVATGAGAGAGAEEGVREAYREAGLAEPRHVVVLPSPAAGALAAAWLSGDDQRRAALEQAAAEERRPAAGAGGGTAGAGDGTAGAGSETAGAGDGTAGAGSETVGAGGWAAGAGDGTAGAGGGRAAVFEVLRGLGEPGRVVREAVRTAPWERARRAAYAELGPAGWAALWDETGGRLWPQADRLITAIRRGLAELGGEELRRVTLDAVLGQHDAPWLAAFDKLDGHERDGGHEGDGGRERDGGLGGHDGNGGRERNGGLGGHDRDGGRERGGGLGEGGGLKGLRRVAGCAGWWWPYERVAVVTERPVELHLDDLGRLHRADGPALAYADGFALHAWHGMPVPAGFGASMRELTPERIRAEENAELRRAMLEHFGLDRYLAESGARPLQRDETGVLWRIELPDDEPITMVEVVNSTPEPDGTRRTYFLRVPPWIQRARQGVAWTFGVEEKDYHPERET